MKIGAAFVVAPLFLMCAGGTAYAQTASPATANQTFPGKNTPLFETTFENDHGLIFIAVRVGKDKDAADKGPSLNFILDTGSAPTVLTKEASESNKLVLGKELPLPPQAKRIGGVGDLGHVSATRLVEADLKVSNVHLQLPLVVLPGGEPLKAIGCEGVLGSDLFQNLVVEIDYTNYKVRFYDPETYRAPTVQEGFTPIPLYFSSSDDRPYIKADLTPFGYNTTLAHLLIDTGADAGVILYSPFVMRSKWDKVLPQTVPMLHAGISGVSTAYEARLKVLGLSTVNVDRPPVTFSAAKSGALASEEADGSMGEAILSRFTSIIDYSRKVLYIRPNESAAEPFPDRYYYGFSARLAMKGDTVLSVSLVEVVPGSSIARAGIRDGEILYTLDGVNMTEKQNWKKIDTLLDAGGEHIFEVGDADGKNRRKVKVSPIVY